MKCFHFVLKCFCEELIWVFLPTRKRSYKNQVEVFELFPSRFLSLTFKFLLFFSGLARAASFWENSIHEL